VLTTYDEEHLVIYLRLLDADADHASWQEAAHLILQINPALEPDRARLAFESHLSRAKWMMAQGYSQLLQGQKSRGSL
jgi:hypothetical protein